MSEFVKVAEVGELNPGDCKHIELDMKEVALFNVEGEYYAINGTCVHQGGPLGEGFLEADVVTCPWHGWMYNVKSGQCTNIPSVKVDCYPVKLEGNDILVEL